MNKINTVKQYSTKSWLFSVIRVLLLVWLLAACSPSSNPIATGSIYEGTPLDGTASDFRLTNQHGETIALSDFRGKVVVLTFMDTQCVDTCPLTALDLRHTYQNLGDNASHTIFIGVNVTLEASSLEDVAAASHTWRLDELPNWHFLTGDQGQLEPVWKAYDIEIMPPHDDTGDLMHTPGVYVIDQAGQLRWYISTPFVADGTPAPSYPLDTLLTTHIQQLLSEA